MMANAAEAVLVVGWTFGWVFIIGAAGRAIVWLLDRQKGD